MLRRPDLPDHPGQVALPGGTVKPGEDAWRAAAREVEEEIGVAAADLEPIGAGAAIYLTVIVVRTVLFGNEVPGYPSLLAVVLLLGGAQLLTLGIIGEYLARVFNEVKRRPLYLTERFEPSGGDAGHQGDG